MQPVNVGELIDRSNRYGLKLIATAGELVIEGYASPPATKLIGELRTHQAAVIAALAGASATTSARAPVPGELQREPLPRAMWRQNLEDGAEAWRYFDAMTGAGYRVRLVFRMDPDRWHVLAPAAEEPPSPALPGELARSFETFAEAWGYWSEQSGYDRVLSYEGVAQTATQKKGGRYLVTAPRGKDAKETN